MKGRIPFAILLIVCLLAFAGCSCKHVWTEADCLNPKTCSECQITEGTALGHDWAVVTCETAKTCNRCGKIGDEPQEHNPGEWTEVTDAVSGTASKEQSCTDCDKRISSETKTLSTLIRDDLFLFTPREFMERLTLIAGQHADTFTYEFVNSTTGLQVIANSNGHESIIQFFRSEVETLSADKIDSAEVWCVSLCAIDEADADFRLYFFMACDPLLDKDAAFEVDAIRAANYLDAAARGEAYGFYQQNQLVYQSLYVERGALGQDYSLAFVNVYASDYR